MRPIEFHAIAGQAVVNTAPQAQPWKFTTRVFLFNCFTNQGMAWPSRRLSCSSSRPKVAALQRFPAHPAPPTYTARQNSLYFIGGLHQTDYQRLVSIEVSSLWLAFSCKASANSSDLKPMALSVHRLVWQFHFESIHQSLGGQW